MSPKKWIPAASLALLASASATLADARAPEPPAPMNRAVYVSIYGVGPAVDAGAYRTVRMIIGGHVADGTIDRFVVDGYGVEGGFGACLELSMHSDDERLSEIIAELKSVRPNPSTTSYQVEAVSTCRRPDDDAR
jgi:hypothetical protein